MKILHLITGGTITGSVPEYKEIELLSHIFMDNVDIGKHIIYSMQAKCEYSFIKICEKDSRNILDIDRKRIGDEIINNYKKNNIKLFLITHGTYTMPDTGKFLENYIEKDILEDISVIITGSMFPWNVFGSDAPMNIGASISSLLNAENSLGVKINMHGKNWNVNHIEKDAENLLFVEK